MGRRRVGDKGGVGKVCWGVGFEDDKVGGGEDKGGVGKIGVGLAVWCGYMGSWGGVGVIRMVCGGVGVGDGEAMRRPRRATVAHWLCGGLKDGCIMGNEWWARAVNCCGGRKLRLFSFSSF